MSPSTSASHPSNPALYRSLVIQVLGPSLNSRAGVIDLTGYIDCSECIASAPFGSVHIGKWKGVNDLLVNDSHALPPVAVKVVSLSMLCNEEKNSKQHKKLQKELNLWKRLDHDNILPLIGIAQINGDFAFISPWMEGGTVLEYLEANPSSSPFGFFRDIIEGLHYLHHFDPEIIHGDIRAVNVLVNRQKKGYLCDFDSGRIATSDSLWIDTDVHASGAVRWMAPELLLDEKKIVTKASDIYAYGMTIYEIISRARPFASLHNDGAVCFAVMSQQRPERDILQGLSEYIWKIMTQCWAHEPRDRPSTEAVLRSVQEAAILIEHHSQSTPERLTEESREDLLDSFLNSPSLGQGIPSPSGAMDLMEFKEKSLKIYHAQGDATKRLKRPVKVLFTLTPKSNDESSASYSTIAWKILDFSNLNKRQSQTLTLYPCFGFALFNQEEEGFVRASSLDISVIVPRGHRAVLNNFDDIFEWSIELNLAHTDENFIGVLNNTDIPESFALCMIDKTNPEAPKCFPVALLAKTRPRKDIQCPLPVLLHAFAVSRCQEGQIVKLRDLKHHLFKDRKPFDIASSELPEKSTHCLYTKPTGQNILEPESE